jgi:hypothetical protein
VTGHGTITMLIKVTAEPRFLRVIASGEFTPAEAEKTFLEVIDGVAMHKTGKVLFDGREVVGEPTIIQRFYYGNFAARAVARYAAETGRPAPQFAFVLEEPVLDPNRFGEKVARNRGMNIRVFDNLEAAFNWLQLEFTERRQRDT